MNKIDMFDTYKQLLATTSMEVTEEGFVRMEIDENEYIPVTAKDQKIVVLPLVERLRDKKVDEYEIFHLLRDGGGKDSDLMSRYRHWLINRLNLVLGGLGGILLDIAASPGITKILSPEQQAYLGMVADADVDSVKNFDKLAEMASKANQIQQVFVSVYLQPAAVLDVNGEKVSFNRVARFNFPIFDAIKDVVAEDEAYKAAPKAKKPTKGDGKIFGAAIRVKDRDVFLGLLKYMLPELDVRHRYDIGSNSRISPSLDAMMRGFLPMITHLNAIMELFTGVKPEIDRAISGMMIPTDWEAAFENLDVLWPQIRSVPTQSVGALVEPAPTDLRQNATVAATVHSPYNAPAAPPPWALPTPTPHVQPTQTIYGSTYAPPVPVRSGNSGGGMDVGEMMRGLGGGRHAPQQQHPGYVQPQQPYYPPPAATMYPGQQQYQPQQQQRRY
jgi:hypothetical protein